MNDKFYQVKDLFIDDLIVETTQYFKKFIEKEDDSSLQGALKTIESAISHLKAKIKANKNIDSNDLAFCLRKYATIIVRDKSNQTRNYQAKKALLEALQYYNDSNFENHSITLEKQRALHQLRKLAYDLKDGLLLKEKVLQLMETLTPCENTPYLIDCYESLSDLAFAKHDFKTAIYYVEKGLELCGSTSRNTARIHRLDTENHLTQMKFFHKINALNILSDMKCTLHRLEAKIKLAELELSSSKMSRDEICQCFIEIEDVLWSAYNGHAKGLNFARVKCPIMEKKYKQQLLKDLFFMFCLVCKKCLLDFDHCDPLQCVLEQARTVFLFEDDDHYVSLENMLQTVITSIFQHHCLVLGKPLFNSSSPIVIKFPEEKIPLLFDQMHEKLSPSNSN